jgi:L-amino acid N-acyltransferase YncA
MAYTYEKLGDPHRTAVIDIFNYYIANSLAAYPEEPVGYEFFDRFLEMAQGYPAVAVKDDTGTIVGFAFLHAYRPGRTFRRVAEITYFIRPDHTGKGLGSAVLKQLGLAAKTQGIDTLLANISSRNEGSLRFHRKNGFEECGRFRRIGRKFGEDFDVVWMQLGLLDAPNQQEPSPESRSQELAGNPQDPVFCIPGGKCYTLDELEGLAPPIPRLDLEGESHHAES